MMGIILSPEELVYRGCEFKFNLTSPVRTTVKDCHQLQGNLIENRNRQLVAGF